LGRFEQLVAQDFIDDSGGGRGETKRVGVGPGGLRFRARAIVFGERRFPIVGAKTFFRNGFRLVVFSVIIMIVVLFFRQGIMGERELTDVWLNRRRARQKKKEAGK
jgi:hypothetical protein